MKESGQEFQCAVEACKNGKSKKYRCFHKFAEQSREQRQMIDDVFPHVARNKQQERTSLLCCFRIVWQKDARTFFWGLERLINGITHVSRGGHEHVVRFSEGQKNKVPVYKCLACQPVKILIGKTQCSNLLIRHLKIICFATDHILFALSQNNTDCTAQFCCSVELQKDFHWRSETDFTPPHTHRGNSFPHLVPVLFVLHPKPQNCRTEKGWSFGFQSTASRQ